MLKLNLKNKKIIFTAIFIVFTAGLSAQVTIDPNVDFYESAREWQVRGYVDFLPQMSPYPAAVIKSILETVIEKGRPVDIECAQYYYEKYFGKKWHIGLEAGAKINLSSNDEEWNRKFGFVEPSFFGDLVFKDWITFGYDLGLNIHNDSTESSEMLLTFTNDHLNTWGDPASIGPLEANWDMVAGVNIGMEMINGIVGANRLGYANIFGHDNIILNPNSYHMNNFLFNFASEKIQYSQTVSQIAAKNFLGEHAPNKFLAFHSLRFTPIKQLAISYYEAAIIGERFDPSYFIPVPFILLQGMFDASDNDIYGIQIEYRPIDRLEAALSFAIDDISIDDWGKGNFNSKFKAALQTGVVYTPESDFCKMLSLDYTLVMPYMYSHWINSPSNNFAITEDMYNYQNYMNHGVCIGSSLPPNSDRLHFEIHFEPVKRLKLDVFTNCIRHANQTESWEYYEVLQHGNKFYGLDTSGGVENDPYPKTVQERFTFMEQEHKMYLVQLGLNSSYEVFRNNSGALSLNFGYAFEHIYNRGVDKPIYGTSIKGEYTFENALAVEMAKLTWINNLYNTYNNYFSLSAKYTY